MIKKLFYTFPLFLYLLLPVQFASAIETSSNELVIIFDESGFFTIKKAVFLTVGKTTEKLNCTLLSEKSGNIPPSRLSTIIDNEEYIIGDKTKGKYRVFDRNKEDNSLQISWIPNDANNLIYFIKIEFTNAVIETEGSSDIYDAVLFTVGVNNLKQFNRTRYVGFWFVLDFDIDYSGDLDRAPLIELMNGQRIKNEIELREKTSEDQKFYITPFIKLFHKGRGIPAFLVLEDERLGIQVPTKLIIAMWKNLWAMNSYNYNPYEQKPLETDSAIGIYYKVDKLEPGEQRVVKFAIAIPSNIDLRPIKAKDVSLFLSFPENICTNQFVITNIMINSSPKTLKNIKISLSNTNKVLLKFSKGEIVIPSLEPESPITNNISVNVDTNYLCLYNVKQEEIVFTVLTNEKFFFSLSTNLYFSLEALTQAVDTNQVIENKETNIIPEPQKVVKEEKEKEVKKPSYKEVELKRLEYINRLIKMLDYISSKISIKKEMVKDIEVDVEALEGEILQTIEFIKSTTNFLEMEKRVKDIEEKYKNLILSNP